MCVHIKCWVTHLLFVVSFTVLAGTRVIRTMGWTTSSWLVVAGASREKVTSCVDQLHWRLTHNTVDVRLRMLVFRSLNLGGHCCPQTGTSLQTLGSRVRWSTLLKRFELRRSCRQSHLAPMSSLNVNRYSVVGCNKYLLSLWTCFIAK